MGDIYFTIVIPTFNDWQRLSRCVDALGRQSYPQSNFEVIIVNNNPSDPKPNRLIFPGNVKIIDEHESGSYVARNAALRIAKGQIIGFTDSDCVPSSDWISNACLYFTSNPHVLRIAGQIQLFYKDEKPNSIELYDTVFAFRQAQYVKDEGFGVTGNMFAHRELFEAVGQFNPRLKSGGDSEWGKRASAMGYPIGYAQDVLVKHPARFEYTELKRKTRRLSGGHLVMSSKKHTTGTLVLRLVKNLKPSRDDLHSIFRNDNINGIQKIIVFALRYRLNFLLSVEKLKIHLGKQPERL